MYDYSDVYVLVKRTATVVWVGAAYAKRVVERNDNKATVKSCATFSDCLVEKNKIYINNWKDLDVAILMYKIL